MQITPQTPYNGQKTVMIHTAALNIFLVMYKRREQHLVGNIIHELRKPNSPFQTKKSTETMLKY